jgi:hypothetical protein
VWAFYVSNPAEPVVATSHDTGFPAHDVFVHEQYLYVANGEGGLLVLRVIQEQT